MSLVVSCVLAKAVSRPAMQIAMSASSMQSTMPSAMLPFSLSKPTMKLAMTNIPAA